MEYLKFYFFFIAPEYVLITSNGVCAHRNETDYRKLSYCETKIEASMIKCKNMCSEMNECVGFTYKRLQFDNGMDCILYPSGKECIGGIKYYSKDNTATSWKDLRSDTNFDTRGIKAVCYGKLSGIVNLSLSSTF